MRVIDPGHVYEVRVYDAPTDTFANRTYMKREGPKYPGNVGSHPGTNLQEGWRADIDRLKYLDQQEDCPENHICIDNLRQNLRSLERRAARRHNRPAPDFWEDVENQPTCPQCGHIGCEGTCRESGKPAKEKL